MKPIYGTIAGSLLFGTAVNGSDVDIRGVHIPSKRDIVFQRVKPENTPLEGIRKDNVLQQATSMALRFGVTVDTSSDDIVSMPLHQYLTLVAGGEVTTVETIFAPNHLWLTDMMDLQTWMDVLSIRSKIVTKKVKRAVGFCNGVAIKFGVRAERLDAAIKAQALFNDLVKSHGNMCLLHHVKDEIMELTKFEAIEYDDETDHNVPMLRVCGRGLQFTSSLKNSLYTLDGIVNSYGKRARASLNPDKKDWKAVMHAHRVADQMHELLAEGTITFPRPNAAYLQQIRNGDVSMETLTATLEENMGLLDEASARSSLPEEADMEAIESLVTHLYMNA